ncbi:MAG TPA: CDP-alcohol phosphatidyltransferase family protein [Solirubrobacterales bacterium]|nr:CDP-alcohol phosphatidyltransferase family protein [Solirubrobacterales bacterium]
MRTGLTVPWTVLAAGVLLFAGLALTAGLDDSGLGPAGWAVGLVSGGVMSLALAGGCSYWGTVRLGPADWVTLTRAALAAGIAALVADSFADSVPVALLVSLASLALVLDAVDGRIARRTGTTSALGEHMDAEVDAFLILVLSVYVARSAGAWVLAIGAARYAFLVAGYVLPWLRAPLPPRYWRKVVCATQGIVLTVAAAQVLPSALTDAALAGALVLLAESFGRDVWWSWRHRDGEAAGAETGAGPALLDGQSSDPPPSDPGPEPEDGPPAGRGPWRGRIRAVIAAVLTILSFLLVWAVLVAPDQPTFVKAGAFLRVPLEGLVVVGIAIFLPVNGRRILAVLTGLALALVVVLKVINYEIFSLFSRAFEPLGDIGQFGNALETLRLEQGASQARLIEIGAVAGVVAAIVLLPLAMLRVTRVAADHRQRALRVIGGLAGVWLIFGVLGTTLVSRTPIASTISAGIVFDTAKVVRAEVHDEGVFAKQIKHDTFRDTPTNQLLTALRGKDVLLVFAESFGRVAIEESSFAPEVNEALTAGDKRLASAGFHSRSGFLISSTFGGGSWLAHSSLQAGLWVHNLRRYAQLLPERRFTLASAFNRAGWRTVDEDVSNNRPWPEGKHFYHWDKVYNRNQVGYKGPTFSYAAMPDQYIYSALQRLELGKAHRPPLFAEVDTVSSHQPWNRIPEEIPWDKVGNGSIYKHLSNHYERESFLSFWDNPEKVQAGYGKTIVYTLNSLTKFIQHYGKKNLVVIELGDHQPRNPVTGEQAGHQVPISIIAHDPRVLKAIEGWGWNPGLRPRKEAPVWPMSSFRNKFFEAFDSNPAAR